MCATIINPIDSTGTPVDTLPSNTDSIPPTNTDSSTEFKYTIVGVFEGVQTIDPNGDTTANDYKLTVYADSTLTDTAVVVQNDILHNGSGEWHVKDTSFLRDSSFSFNIYTLNGYTGAIDNTQIFDTKFSPTNGTIVGSWQNINTGATGEIYLKKTTRD